MDVSIATALAVGTAVFTAAGAWVTVRGATVRHETALEKIEKTRATDLELGRREAAVLESRVLDRLKEYSDKRDEQGRRIGRLDQRLSRVEGLIASEPPRRRAVTGAIPIQSDEDTGL
jgi:hypothetical protein